MPRARKTALRREQLTPGDPVVLYARDSGGNEQERSVDQQLTDLRKHCQERGYAIAREYADRIRSGTTTAGREAFEAMVDDLRNGASVAGVLFYAINRLARDQLDWQFFVADLRRRGYFVGSIADNIPAGEFQIVFESLNAWMAEKYSKDLGRDIRRGLHDLVARGYGPGGVPPRGYKAVGAQTGTTRDGRPRMASRWVIDDEWATRVRRAWEMRAAGASYPQILAETGVYRTKNSLGKMFHSEAYIGHLVVGGVRYENHAPPLVDEATWLKVQALARHEAEQRGGRPVQQRARTYLLSGLIFHDCGARMFGGHDHPHGKHKAPYWYYRCLACNAKVNATYLNQEIVDLVLNRFLTPERLRAFVAAVNADIAARVGDSQADLERLDRELADVDRAISRLLRAVEESDAPPGALMARLREREIERKRLQAERAELDRQRRPLDVDETRLAAMRDELHARLAGESVVDARAVLRTFVKRVTVGADKEVVVEYTFPFG